MNGTEYEMTYTPGARLETLRYLAHNHIPVERVDVSMNRVRVSVDSAGEVVLRNYAHAVSVSRAWNDHAEKKHRSFALV